MQENTEIDLVEAITILLDKSGPSTVNERLSDLKSFGLSDYEIEFVRDSALRFIFKSVFIHKHIEMEH